MNGNDLIKVLVVLNPNFGCEAVDKIIELVHSGLTKITVYMKYVVDMDPVAGLYIKEEQFTKMRKKGQEIIEQQVKRLQDAGLDVEILPSHFGIATEEILRVEKQIKPDLVVTSAPVLSTFRRLLTGDFSENVVRKAKVPVLTVRPTSASV